MRRVIERLPWGSTVERADGPLVRVRDRGGTEVCALRWRNGALDRARLRLPGRGHVEIEARQGTHPLFGQVDRVWVGGETRPRGCFAALDWSRPGFIPPLDRPGVLPPGAGSAILNLVARRAADVELQTLRYRGPYPTAALFGALLSSFRVRGDREAARSRFCADVEALAVRGRMEESTVDFEPAPHEWLFVDPRACVQVRDGIERVYVDGQAFDPEGLGARRLRAEGDLVVAGIEIAGTWWADVARFDRRGTLRDGPHPLPALGSPLEGMQLPSSVTQVLGEIMLGRAPALMRPTLQRLWSTVALRFEDTQALLARGNQPVIEVHALLGERLDALDSREQLDWLLRAVEPVAHRWAQNLLATEHGDPLG